MRVLLLVANLTSNLRYITLWCSSLHIPKKIVATKRNLGQKELLPEPIQCWPWIDGFNAKGCLWLSHLARKKCPCNMSQNALRKRSFTMINRYYYSNLAILDSYMVVKVFSTVISDIRICLLWTDFYSLDETQICIFVRFLGLNAWRCFYLNPLQSNLYKTII